MPLRCVSSKSQTVPDQRSTMSTLSGPARWLQTGCSRLTAASAASAVSWRRQQPSQFKGAVRLVDDGVAPAARRWLATNLGQDLGDGGALWSAATWVRVTRISQVEESQVEMKFR
jgi:hypothetical protein